jgi:protein-disulfide isomerase-like protein with CxxC motif
MIAVTYFSDPACPWAYSVNPALHVLRWRYGDQLDWRLVTIGLTESAAQYEARGYTPEMQAHTQRRFRRYGMPFLALPKARAAGTGRACRAIVAARLQEPGSDWAVFRALQLAWFTTDLLLDEDEAIATVLRSVPGVDAEAIVAAIDGSDEVRAAYEDDKAQARSAAGSATEAQGKARVTDGPVRYTAPSLLFASNGSSLEAGGFQTIEAYDVVVANLDPTLERADHAPDAAAVLERFPDGVTTQEVAAVMAPPLSEPDRDRAEDALIALAAEGRADKVSLGNDAIWTARRAA